MQIRTKQMIDKLRHIWFILWTPFMYVSLLSLAVCVSVARLSIKDGLQLWKENT